MKFRKFLSVPVLAVVLVAGFVYYITVFVFIEDWAGLRSSPGALNSILFTLLASFFLFSFCSCVTTDPGHVPSSYVPDVEDSERHTNAAETRLCDKCFTYKPLRAHHCRVCKRCVLKMDHHCLWINNCVGYFNYKAFFILVLYATVASIYSTVMLICCIFRKSSNYSQRLTLKLFYVSSGVVTVGLSMTLATLLGWHIYLISRNMTTIEHYEGIRAAWLARKSGQTYKHPFDLGVYRNIALVLGPNMLKWLCPTAINHLKDGTSFPVPRENS